MSQGKKLGKSKVNYRKPERAMFNKRARRKGKRAVRRGEWTGPLGAGEVEAPVYVDPPEDPRIDDALAEME